LRRIAQDKGTCFPDLTSVCVRQERELSPSTNLRRLKKATSKREDIEIDTLKREFARADIQLARIIEAFYVQD